MNVLKAVIVCDDFITIVGNNHYGQKMSTMFDCKDLEAHYLDKFYCSIHSRQLEWQLPISSQTEFMRLHDIILSSLAK